MNNVKKIDLLITMELIDYTVNEYMREWLPEALGTNEIPVTFIRSGDTSQDILP